MTQFVMIGALGLMFSTGAVLYASSDLPEEAIGYDAESTYNISDYESINLANGNLGFRLPLYSLSTDGGLTYNLALQYNSKMWETRQVCVEDTCGSADDPCGSCFADQGDDQYMAMEIATGIESYGFGWDLRPARIEPSNLEAPGVAGAFAWVDPTGAKHHLDQTEPWEHAPSDGDHVDCVFSAANPTCYTIDGSNLRLTAETFDGNNPTRIVVEAPDGTLFVHTHVVSPALWNVIGVEEEANFAEEAAAFNFRTGVGGLYLTSIEKGPWSGSTPANKITFEYCGESGTSCPAGAWPWLVERIAVEGQDDREVEIQYLSGAVVDPDVGSGLPQMDTFVIDRVTIPQFAQASEGPAYADIVFSFDDRVFSQFNADYTGDPLNPIADLQVPTLTSVTFPDGGTFAFDPEPSWFPLGSVTLPTGAKISYVVGHWPVKKSRIPPSTDFCDYNPNREAGPPPGSGNLQDRASWSFTDGLTARFVEYADVFNSRVDVTIYKPGISCEETIPTGEGDAQQWPYDFRYAFDDDSFFPAYRFVYVGTSSYKPVGPLSPRNDYIEMVQDQQDSRAGDEDPFVWDFEVHRFTLDSLEEFSADHFEIAPAARFYLPGVDFTMEPLMHADNSDWKVLRHEEIEHDEPFDVGKWTAPQPYGGTLEQEFARYSHVKEKRVFTDEAGSSADGTSDVSDCYPVFTDWTAPPADPLPCTPVSTVVTVDDYLNEKVTSTTYPDPVTTSLTTKTTTRLFDDVYQTDPTRWYLGLRTKNDTCIGSDCVTQGWNWAWQYGRYVVVNEFNHPTGQPGSFSCPGDCTSHEYTYDTDGNLTTDKIGGGYGSGFLGTAMTTETTYSHGRAAKKEIVPVGGGDPLLLWERDVDPASTLIRWHVDGSGAGLVFDFNAVGKVTTIVPVEGSYSEGTWDLANQRTTDPTWQNSASLFGTTVTYTYPGDGTDFLEHRVFDAQCLVLYNSINYCTPNAERSRYVYDELGRRMQVVETIPPSEGYSSRTRFDLRLFKQWVDADDTTTPCYVFPAGGLATVGPFQISSSWIGGTNMDGPWPITCSDLKLNWSHTQLDGLGRARRVIQPDGAILSTNYWGDTISVATRDVATNLDGTTETSFSVDQTKDALGRLRRVEEDITGTATVTSLYGYDVADRLVSVDVGDVGSTQGRSFLYSPGGFLTASTEPERDTTFTDYDALGNLTALMEDVTNISLVYDEWGRHIEKWVNSAKASEYFFGDVTQGSGGTSDPRSDELAMIGEPSYNKVVIATQNNWFAPNTASVTVTDEWWHGGPGGAVSHRQTAISGFGDPDTNDDDRFTVTYGYDRWSNQSWVGHPVWSPVIGCQDAISEQRQFDGAWLKGISAYVNLHLQGENPVPDEIAAFEYSPDGRVHHTKYGPSGTLATLTETPDDYGMGRPKGYSLVDGQRTPPWSTGNYFYDGSGNIKAIGDRQFAYDGLNRLTEFGYSLGVDNFGQSFGYDRFGNMESLVKTAGEDSTMTYDGSNRITGLNGKSFSHDGRGNVTAIPGIPEILQRQKSFVFSGEDRLMESQDIDPAETTTWRYAYNSAGERVVRWMPSGVPDESPSEVRLNIRDEGGQVLNDWLWLSMEPNDPLLSNERDYIYGPSGMVAQMEWGGEPRTLFAATDHLGHTRALFDGERDPVVGSLIVKYLDFAPFGEQIEGVEPPDTTHLFTGHERDLGTASSELDYMHARYYSPFLARFVSVDPVGGSVGSSQSWNRYSYALGNPLSVVDPDGRDEYVLTWVQKGDNVGHSASAVQVRDSNGSPTGQVMVQDLWPSEPVGFPGLDAPAQYNATIMGEGDLASFTGHGEGRPADGMILITGDQQQDATFQAGLDDFMMKNLEYGAKSVNCSDYTTAGVKTTGLPTGTGGTVSVSVGPVSLSEDNVSTPVALHNAIAGSNDPRVEVIKKVPNSDPNLRLQ